MDIEVRLEPARAEDGDRSSGFLQSIFWGEFKASFGWKAIRFRAGLSGSDGGLGGDARPGDFDLLVLLRSFAGRFSFAYVPHGPELDPGPDRRGDFLVGLARALGPRLPRSCVFIRFEPPWYHPERPRFEPPLRKARADVQPPDTVIVDLGPSEEGILAAMKPKWRYNVRLAEKKGVEVERRGRDSLGDFYRLYRETAERDRIALHPLEYYERLFELADEPEPRGAPASSGAAAGIPRPDIRLWLALAGGRPIAGIVTLFRGAEAVYLYGASSGEGRNLMPAYALQWAAMRAAKDSGCLTYDLFGVPPDDDPLHPMAGLRRFKTGFGGVEIHRAGAWDFPLSTGLYRAFGIAEGARRWWYKDLMKRRRGSSSD